MKRVIIDTNGLISFVTDRNPKQQQKIAQLFADAATLKKIILCNHHVLSEFVYVLSSVYSVPLKNIHSMLTDFLAMPGIELVTNVNINTILSYWPDHIQDYGDAVVAAQCKNSPTTTVTTFDRKFRNELATLGLPVFEL